jgi:hypothetical protein
MSQTPCPEHWFGQSFFAARFAVVADCAFAQGNAGGGVARTVVVTVVWATWKGAIVSHEPTVALALAV